MTVGEEAFFFLWCCLLYLGLDLIVLSYSPAGSRQFLLHMINTDEDISLPSNLLYTHLPP